MSTTIDNRIVQMEFNNKNFEQNAQESLSTLNKLTKALKFDKAADGLKGIENAANRTNLSGLESGVIKVQNQFSSLQAIAFTALQNITNTAIVAGKRVVNALAIDPVTTGFEEYETQINAVQTILSNTRSKGTTIDDVNRALDELNTYADKTIYNFTEMTRNIGTFTAAGVDLQTATKSIQGIANLAAVSGSTSQQASTAMYQLSQALATGTVKLQDWNSVVNAGMGGEVFQNALKRTAKVMGTDVDAIIEKEGSFRESLTKGEWLTTEVLTETLNQFANVYSKKDLIKKGYTEKEANEILELGQDAENAATKVKTLTQLWDTLKEAAQSGWTQSWEILVGDFYQARTLLTDISESIGAIINAQSEARNTLLKQAFGKSVVDAEKWDDTVKKLGKGSEEFLQKAVVRSAGMYGINVSQMIDKGETFKDSLKKGWLSAEILEGAFRFNRGLSDIAATEKVAEANSKKLSDAVKENLSKNFKTGKDRFEDLNKQGYTAGSVLSQLSEVLRKNGANLAYWNDDVLKSAGYTKKQINAFHELIDVTSKEDDYIAQLIQDIERPSGRELLIESAKNILLTFGDAIKAVGKAWHNVFGTITGFGIYDAILQFRDLTKSFKLTKEGADNITASVTPLFIALKTVLSIIKVGIKFAGQVLLIGIRILGFLLRIVNAVISFARGVKDATTASKDFNILLSNIGSAIDYLKSSFGKFINSVGKFGKELQSIPALGALYDSFVKFGKAVSLFALDKLSVIITGIGKFFELVGKFIPKDTILAFINELATGFSNIVNKFTFDSSKGFGIGIFADKLDGESDKLENAKNHFKRAKDNIKGVLIDFKDLLSKVPQYINFDRIIDMFKTGTIIYILVQIAKIFQTIKKITKGGKKATDSLKDILDETANTLKAYQSQIRADSFKTLAEAIGILAAAMFALSFVPSEKLAAVTVDLAVLMLLMALIVKIGVGLKSGSEKLQEGVDGIKESLTNFIDSFKDSITQSAKLIAFGVFAVLLAGAVAVLAVTMTKLINIPWTAAMTALGFLTAITALLVFSAKLINDHAGDLNTGMGMALLGMGAAILLFAQAATIFAGMNLEELAKGLGSVAALLVLTAVLSKASSGNNMISLSVGMLIMAGSLLALIPALLAFSKIPWDVFGHGIAQIGAMALVFAVASRISSSAVQFGAGLLLVAVAMNALLVPIMAIGAAWKVAVIGMVAIAGMLAAIVGLGYLAVGAAIGLQALGIAALEIAGSIALAGAGFLMMGLGATFLAGGIYTLGKALPALANGLVSFCATIVNNSDVLVKGFSTIMSGIALAIIASKGRIGIAVVSVILGVLSALETYGPAILAKIAEVIGSIWNWLVSDLPGKLGTFVSYMIQGIAQLAQAIFEARVYILNAIANIETQIMNMFLEFVAGLVERIPGVGKKFASLLRSWKQPVESIFGKEEGEKKSKEWGEGVYNGVSEIPKALEGIDFTSGITDSFANFDMSSIGDEYKNDFFKGFNLDDPKATAEIEKLKKNLDSTDMTKSFKLDVSGADKLKDIQKVQDQISKKSSTTKVNVDTGGAKKALTSLNATTTKSTSSMIKTLSTFSKAAKNHGKTAGTGFSKEFSSSVEKGKGPAKTAAGHVATSAAKGARKYDSFRSSGVHCMNGLIAGFNSKMGEVRASANRAAAIWNQTYQKSKHQKISSPSKTQFKNGQFTVQGLINGITERFKALKRSASTAAEIVDNSLSRPIDALFSALSADMETTPVITPVINLDDVQSGLATIDGAFGQRTLALSTSMANSTNSAFSDFNQNRNNNPIISELGKLRSDLSNIKGDTYNVNGVTYGDGSAVQSAISTLVRAAIVEGRA